MKTLQIPEIQEINKFKTVSLQVPDNIDLSKMSDDEISRLAVDLSQRAAANVPKGSTLLGIDGVSLTNMARPNWTFGIFWSRACSVADIDPTQLTINPALFEPVVMEKGQADSYRATFKAPIAGISKGTQKPTK